MPLKDAKRRVLWVGESSCGHTGFCVYSRELLKRLHATEKYDLAELACYGSLEDPARQGVPWKFYSNLPTNVGEQQRYLAAPSHQWGEWRFEDVLLSHQSGAVCDARDFWNFEFETRSPFRRFYKLGLMPAWDSSPVYDQWIAGIKNADALLSYSEWAVNEMREQVGDAPPIVGVAPAGVDHNVFKIQNKAATRQALGLPSDCLLVGFIGRNQQRKLIPDLIEAFALMKQYSRPGIRERLRLYLHTAYPDGGWDIPRFLKDFGVASETYLSYICRDCRFGFAHQWADVRTTCPRCGGNKAMTANGDFGVDREMLAAIYSSCDAYVQMSTCGGQEIPVVEAAACGVKSFVVNYSAMEDYPRTVLAEPISVKRFFWDPPTHTRRALPDNEECAKKLLDWLSQPETVRLAEGAKIAAMCRETYTWDRAASRWINMIDSLPPAMPWNAPPQIHQPRQLPAGLPAWEFVTLGLEHISGRSDLLGSYLHLRLARDLERGTRSPNTGMYNFTEAIGMDPCLNFIPYSMADCENDLLGLAQNKNQWEKRRWAAVNRK